MNDNKKIPIPRLLPIVATIVTFAGALASLGLVLQKGHRNNSVLLIALFVGWVLSPFVALLVARVISKSWSLLSRRTLYVLMFVVTLGSLVAYSGVLSPADAKPAFVFLVVPLLSWIIMVIAIAIAASRSRKVVTEK